MSELPVDEPWRDPVLPAGKRAELLLAAMTPAEKVGQLGSRWIGNDPSAEPQPEPNARVEPNSPAEPDNRVKPNSPAEPNARGQSNTPVQADPKIQPQAPVQADPTVQPEAPVQVDPEVQADPAIQADLTVQADPTGQLYEAGQVPAVAPMEGTFADGRQSLEEASRDGLGHLTRVWGSVPVGTAEGAAEVIRQHRIVLANSRLNIPALVHEECLTGFTTYGATVYPTPLAWAATFDPPLVERMATAIGQDLANAGVHQGLSPVLDVVRDYRWGRVEETLGEDPYLVALLGSAYVRGLQSRGVIATLKHFAGYSASRAARNHGPVSMGRRELLDVILPVFEVVIRTAGAGSVMCAYNDVDGVPATVDSWLLTEVLRGEWEFDGTVVSDYWSVPFLATMHRVARDPAEAGARALAAGTDVELPDTVGFRGLLDRLESGELSMELVDRAARRVLLQKIQLGLLDPGWTPETSVRPAELDLDSAENQALAAELAERSIVLLDAGSALPVSGPDRPAPERIAVVGPCADDPLTFLGCYAFPNHVLPRFPDLPLGIEIQSALQALRHEFPGTEITYQAGCEIRTSARTGFVAAEEAANGTDAAARAAEEAGRAAEEAARAAEEAVWAADLCVAFVGDRSGLFGQGTSGEGCDAEDLRLPGAQGELIERLLRTGTPVVVVVVSGRPYALGEIAGRAAGLVQAFLPGQAGAAAIAGVLSGRIVPGGKLPVQIPRHPGGQPGTYLQPPLGTAESAGISSLETVPLYPFGYGSSYTRFTVGDLRLSASEVPTDAEFTVTAKVTNVGERTGDEVVQLYLHDVVAQVARPVWQLTGFARVTLEPGEAVDVTFEVHADRTAYTGPELRQIVEPGEIEVGVGTSSADLPCRGLVKLTGDVRVVGHDRTMVTPVRLSAVSARAGGGS